MNMIKGIETGFKALFCGFMGVLYGAIGAIMAVLFMGLIYVCFNVNLPNTVVYVVAGVMFLLFFIGGAGYTADQKAE